ncbi:SOS response-associated peptidase [Desulfosporosinus sp. FKA]|uniref:SOS response-associated peptidase n=1 Tax=Desulfosporosinus sp. FKA TaxID=1969834 RepID=UPI001FA91A25|nr:SOS response-associated peptidase [Desulfosporosinus sp. FKA]
MYHHGVSNKFEQESYVGFLRIMKDPVKLERLNVRMCGRFSLIQVKDLEKRFDFVQLEFEFEPRFNIAPSQLVPVVVRENDCNYLRMFRWGLIPSWAKDEHLGSKMINARGETLGEKPSFRKSLEQKRCLVLADDETIHQRMPVILPADKESLWLNVEASSSHDVQGLLTPYPSEQMVAFEVLPYVNSPSYEGPECLTLPRLKPVGFLGD